MRRPAPKLIMLALVLAAGCTTGSPTTPKGGTKVSPSPVASVRGPSATPTVSPTAAASTAPTPTPTPTTVQGSPTPAPSPTPTPTPSPAATPTVTKVDPAIAGAGTKVTLTGTGFNGAGLQVAFGGVAATDTKATDDKTLTATVPSGAAKGEVTVTAAGLTSAALPVTLIKGAVASVGNFMLDLGTSRDVSFTVQDITGKPLPDIISSTTVDGKAAIYKDGKVISEENGSATLVTVAAGVTTKLRVIVKKEATVSNLAGTGDAGHQDGSGTSAVLNAPNDLLLDKDGNLLVLELGGNCLRKIDLHDATHPVTTLAGNGQATWLDGPALQAGLAGPAGMCQGPDGIIYIADSTTPRIRRLKDGAVDTLAGTGVEGSADGNGTAATFKAPRGLVYDAHDPAHPALLIADSGNHRIRRLDLTDPNHAVTTVAGGAAGFADGAGTAAQLHSPGLMQADGQGGVLIADTGNQRIRRLTFAAGAATVATVAGTGAEDFLDGTLDNSALHSPQGVTVDGAGQVFFTDDDNHRIRLITTDGYVVTVAGTGSRGFDNGPAQHNASFKGMRGIAVATDGTIYEADSDNNAVRVIK